MAHKIDHSHRAGEIRTGPQGQFSSSKREDRKKRSSLADDEWIKKDNRSQPALKEDDDWYEDEEEDEGWRKQVSSPSGRNSQNKDNTRDAYRQAEDPRDNYSHTRERPEGPSRNRPTNKEQR